MLKQWWNRLPDKTQFGIMITAVGALMVLGSSLDAAWWPR